MSARSDCSVFNSVDSQIDQIQARLKVIHAALEMTGDSVLQLTIRRGGNTLKMPSAP